jgi:murein DD-endopeptidase MepM/ murein hydrolase activator NlpD
MELGSNRGYCLWVVPPNEGKVRKFRFTFRRVVATAAFTVLTGAMMVYMLSDYARLQLIRVENYLSLSKLNSEHQRLLHSNENLRSQVSNLRTAQTKSATYEQDVKQRLEQLASVIESATALGVFKRGAGPTTARKSTVDKDAVGGAEVDCDAKGSPQCKKLISGGNTANGEYWTLSGVSLNSRNDLLGTLDKYIEALKVIPFGLPARGEVSSGFGVRLSPFTRTIRMHEGMDFSLSRGSNIYASAFGKVKRVERTPTYGLVVDIEHNGRLVTRYAHLSKALVKPGQAISRGDVIGLAGSSGMSTGPHLHFEVLVDGRPRNPARFLELAQRLELDI